MKAENQSRKRRVKYKTYRFKGVVEIFVQKMNVDGIEFDVNINASAYKIARRRLDMVVLGYRPDPSKEHFVYYFDIDGEEVSDDERVD
ncbi:hypothetical protein AAA081_00385 [Aedoeadaptatus acetigenes]|uniref:Uncharacterized protein n=1 Tax=Aedoeadaptatus acetigenes TaxID=2981723 RepID=A0ABV1J669_9FIRM|nr:hypothetical protein [Aedoeadaptatus acetigenes]MCU6786391.1 hypothetical protein [Aedoeadaptatus acetigenes]